jgi:uncharacterized protein with HEPN domain
MAADDALSFIEGMSKEEFLADRRTQQAVIMSLMTAGEVAARIATRHAGFADRHADVPWRKMRGMRNRLVHGYFEVDLDVVWDTVQTAVPELRQSLTRIKPGDDRQE